MTTREQIAECLQTMTDAELEEVLDFVEYLRSKAGERRARKEEEEWSDFSLDSAMRRMEEEPGEYTVDDLKEEF